MVEEKKNLSSEVLKEIAETLQKLQHDLEPIRDRVLDEKAKSVGFTTCAAQFIQTLITEAEKKGRMEGYAQCAEQILAVIATRTTTLFKEAEKTKDKESEDKIRAIADKLKNVSLPEDSFEGEEDKQIILRESESVSSA